MTANHDYAFRRVETTGTSCNKIEAKIILPPFSDMNVGNGALYNYIGCSREGVFDFEFGFGYKPVETNRSDKYGIYRSSNRLSPNWDWIKSGGVVSPLFDPGTYTLSLSIPENNIIKVQVGSYSNTFQISGARKDGAGQKVRRVTSLLVLQNTSGFYARNSRWTSTTIRQGGIESSATSSNCIAGRYSKPTGNIHWVTLNSHKPYYDETISIQIR